MSTDTGPLAIWDVFHADSLELERAVTTESVRAALASGALRDDDLVRPAGAASAWTRLADLPEILEEAPPVEAAPPAEVAPPPVEVAPPVDVAPPAEVAPSMEDEGDFEVTARTLNVPNAPGAPVAPPAHPAPEWLELGGGNGDVAFPVLNEEAPPEETAREAPERILPGRQRREEARSREENDASADDGGPSGEAVVSMGTPERIDVPGRDVPGREARRSFAAPSASHVALPVAHSRDWDDRAPGEDDAEEEEDDFSLSRSGPATVEELDLAPMVDVAFQLVLFFMVTATTVLFKTLEIPKPNADAPPEAVSQGQSRSLDDFKEDYVLVEIDAAGAIKIDHEPVAGALEALIERLRVAREKTGRKTMLVSADFTTAHKNAVLAYDAANEIGMGIAIARPAPPRGAGPGLLSGRANAPRAP